MKLNNLTWLLRNIDGPLEDMLTGKLDLQEDTLALWRNGIPLKLPPGLGEMTRKMAAKSKISRNSMTSEELRIIKINHGNSGPLPYLWIDESDETTRKGAYHFAALPLRQPIIRILLESYCRQKTLIDRFDGVFLLMNNYGEIKHINPSGRELLGYGNEEITGRALNNFLTSPGSLDELEKLTREARGISPGNSTKSQEICLRKKDGTNLYGLASLDQIRNERDDLIYSTLLISDISGQMDQLNNSIMTSLELLDSNEYLKKTQTTLLRTEKMAAVGQLGAGLAHEINNPLSYLMNNITLFSEYTSQLVRFMNLMKDLPAFAGSSCEEEYRKMDLDFILTEMSEMTGEMNEGLGQIEKIIHSLKSFSGNERTSGWNYEDINKALEEMLIISKNRYKYDMEIHREFSEIPRVMCNLTELNQAFLAIFINAVQAVKERTDRGAAGFAKIATMLDESEENVLISFENNGPPLSEEQFRRATDPFYTGWDTKKGSGMGLTVAQDIVTGLHKGDITLDNPDGNTRFTLHIPIIETLKEGN